MSPPHVRNNCTRIAIKVVGQAGNAGYGNLNRGEGRLVLPVRVLFPGGEAVICGIEIVWPVSAMRIARDPVLSTARLDHAAKILMARIARLREEFEDAAAPVRARIAQHLDGIADPARAAAVEARMVALLRAHAAAATLATVAAAVALLLEGVDLGFRQARTDADAEVARRGFLATSGVDDYAGLFPQARAMRRRLVFHVGPTNSGKTHGAMQALLAADSGCYLAPLRLMALEGFDRINAAGTPCDLLTGEEAIRTGGARHVASTIEMLNLTRPVAIAVVDEVQLLSDPGRGWAWTRAVIGAPAATVYLTGSADALPFVERIAAMTGEELTVIGHQRLSPLEALAKRVRLDQVQDGDAIICFSRNSVFLMREALLAAGIPCAMLYGALGPEVRRSEAARFRSGTARVVVATDVIGLGLNLPITRVLLAETEKFDGSTRRTLTGSEIRQICGRAGRYQPGQPAIGYAGVLGDNDPKLVARCLRQKPVPPTDTRLFANPHWELVRDAAILHHREDLAFLLDWCGGLFVGPDLVCADLADLRAVATALRGVLTLEQRYQYLGAPVDARSAESLAILAGWARLHGQGGTVPVPDDWDGTVPETKEALQRLEEAAKRLALWLWLGMRWPEVYADRPVAMARRVRISTAIETCLREKALTRLCRNCRRALPPGSRFPVCDACHAAHRAG